MRAVRATSPGVVETVEVEAPAGEGIRVRVTACGICGSDVHLAEWALPITLGHEITGVLDDGSHVVIEPNPSFIVPSVFDPAVAKAVADAVRGAARVVHA